MGQQLIHQKPFKGGDCPGPQDQHVILPASDRKTLLDRIMPVDKSLERAAGLGGLGTDVDMHQGADPKAKLLRVQKCHPIADHASSLQILDPPPHRGGGQMRGIGQILQREGRIALQGRKDATITGRQCLSKIIHFNRQHERE